MAMAVQRLHKGAQVTIGPWIERGFYYDFDMPQVSHALVMSLVIISYGVLLHGGFGGWFVG